MNRVAVIVTVLLVGAALAHGHDLHGEHATHNCIHNKLSKQFKPVVMDHNDDDHLKLHAGHFAFKNGIEDPLKQNQFHSSHLADIPDPSTAPDGWHQIRIYLDFTFANKFAASQPAVASRYELAARLTQNVRNYFQGNMMANYYTLMKFKGGTCYNNAIAAFERPIDLLVVINPENDQTTSYFAAATSCYLSPRDGRPTVGAYILNFAFLKTTPLYQFLYFSTFAHEFTHILGFSNDLFDRYVDLTTGAKLVNVISQTTITSPDGLKKETYGLVVTKDVVQYARQYYNCPTLKGVPLENDGGEGSAGSHWEKLFLPTEYMNPTVENPGIISEFTFSFLRGTGWYKTRIGSAQYYDWGAGAGCGYHQICPKTASGSYCQKSEIGQRTCSSEYYSKATCVADTTFTSGCPMKRSLEQSCLVDTGATKELNEEFGAYSRCFLWAKKDSYGNAQTNPRCHLTYCENTYIMIKYGNSALRCDKSGQVLSAGESFQLICPNIPDFCGEFYQRCPGDCGAKGICVQGNRCECFVGYGGVDCSQQKSGIDYYHYQQTTTGASVLTTLASLALALLAAVHLA